MARWQFLIADTSGDTQGELIAATGRTVTFNLDDACTAGFTVAGLHPDALLVKEGETDLMVQRSSGAVGETPTLLFRGRITGSTDQVDTGTDTVAFTATDYRGMLGQRYIWPGDTLTYTNVEQVTIGWDLIAATQAKAGGSWGITNASTATGTTRSRTFNAGAAIDQTITTLGDTDGGFDWQIGPDMKYQTWFPARGRVGLLQLDYPARITAFTRGVSLTSYGNAVVTTGADTIDSVAQEASSFGATGRLEQVYSDPDINDEATLTARAAFELAFAAQPPTTWQVTLRPGTWDPADLWLGDVVGLYITRGRLNVDQAVRVTQIQISIDDDGVETVQVTLGPVLLLRGDDTVPDSTATEITASDSVINAPAMKIPSPLQVLQAHSKALAVVKRLTG